MISLKLIAVALLSLVISSSTSCAAFYLSDREDTPSRMFLRLDERISVSGNSYTRALRSTAEKGDAEVGDDIRRVPLHHEFDQSRRRMAQMVASACFWYVCGSLEGDGIPIALAATDATPLDAAFDAVRYELEDPQGGISYMKKCLDQRDFEALLAFSREYDLELRKIKMKTVAKQLKEILSSSLSSTPEETKQLSATLTQLMNNITFDLIGINRGCRKGQESVDQVDKYIGVLQGDIKSFLALQ